MKRRDRGPTTRATGRVEMVGPDDREWGGEREAGRCFPISGPHPAAGDTRTHVHVAVVHGAREVHFVVADTCPSALFKQLCDRLAQDAPDQLWDEDARAFFDLRRAGRVEQAVELYFREIGGRWDAAWLSVHTVRV